MFDNYSFCAPFLCNELSEYQDFLIKSGERRTVQANSTIFRTGDRVQSIYYLAKGRVKLYTTNGEGKEKIFLILGEHTLFGAALSFLSEISLAAAVTETPSVLYVLDPNILKSSVEFKDRVIKYMAKTIFTLMRSVEGLSLYCCKTRLYNLLRSSASELACGEEPWHDLKFQYSQEEMARMINANRVTVARMIHELCDDGSIRIVNRRIQVKVEG